MRHTWIHGIGFSIKEQNLGETRIEQAGQTIKIYYPCSNPFTCTPYIINFPPGTFFIRIYGASGGFAMNGGTKYRGGYGGVSEGVYETDRSQLLFLFIGGSGENYNETQHLKGGFNGGGASYGQSGGGGGSTDIRTSEILSPDSRIVVAGGGGGSRFNGRIGGNGGGENGSPGQYSDTSIPCYGSTSECVHGSGDRISNGTIGKGADGITSWGIGFGGGGGGGGYYGGGSAGNAAGSGGSGFIGGLIYYQNYTSITSYSEHEGNGYAIITVIESKPYYSQCPSFISSFYFNNILIFSLIFVDKLL